jgi:hypothetical protein
VRRLHVGALDSLEVVPVAHTALEDLQREFPDWIVTTDRDFTGLCFAYRPTGSATLRGKDPAELRHQIHGWLRRHGELD